MGTTTGTEGSGLRLLLVDDDQEVARVVAACLAARGFVVTPHEAGARALEELRRHPDAFDVVLTDQEMPGMTGAELIRAALALRPELPMFIYSGHSNTLTPEGARALGARALLQKPMAATQLAAILREAVAPREPG